MKKINLEKKEKNMPSKDKKTFFKKLKKLGQQIKLKLKANFPDRIWSKRQEKRKGPKF